MKTVAKRPARGVRQVDWSDSPEAVLRAVNSQLSKHGLQVVLIEAGDDSYEWFIAPRQKTLERVK